MLNETLMEEIMQVFTKIESVACWWLEIVIWKHVCLCL